MLFLSQAYSKSIVITLFKKDGLPDDSAKSAEADVEKITSTWNKKVDALIEAKEKDILKV